MLILSSKYKYLVVNARFALTKKMVGVGGFEPPTFCIQSKHSSSLSYTPTKKRTTGESLRGLMRPAHNGFEPGLSQDLLRCCPKLERYEKFEFSPSGWKPDVLPLNTNSA